MTHKSECNCQENSEELRRGWPHMFPELFISVQRFIRKFQSGSVLEIPANSKKGGAKSNWSLLLRGQNWIILFKINDLFWSDPARP